MYTYTRGLDKCRPWAPPPRRSGESGPRTRPWKSLAAAPCPLDSSRSGDFEVRRQSPSTSALAETASFLSRTQDGRTAHTALRPRERLSLTKAREPLLDRWWRSPRPLLDAEDTSQIEMLSRIHARTHARTHAPQACCIGEHRPAAWQEVAMVRWRKGPQGRGAEGSVKKSAGGQSQTALGRGSTGLPGRGSGECRCHSAVALGEESKRNDVNRPHPNYPSYLVTYRRVHTKHARERSRKKQKQEQQIPHMFTTHIGRSSPSRPSRSSDPTL